MRNQTWVTGLMALLALHAPALAADATAPAEAEEELSFDEVVEPLAPPAANVVHWYDIIHLNGRFDLNYELEQPMHLLAPAEEGVAADYGQLKNYHRFVFLKVRPHEKLSVEAEIIDQAFYEIHYRLTPRIDLRGGKIWIPFGASPFHHYYGGRQGNPFQGLLLPNVWADYGITLAYPIFNSNIVNVEGDTWLMRGFDGSYGTPLALNVGGTDGRFALGQRLRISFGPKVMFWLSGMYNHWGTDNLGQVLLWGGDFRLDYGIIPLPVLKDIAIKGAFARAEVQDQTLDPTLSPDGWYWRYGDYIEANVRVLQPLVVRLRYGTVIDYDLKTSNKDSHNWTAALQMPLAENLSLLAEYQWNMEEVDEIENDLFRIQTVLEF